MIAKLLGEPNPITSEEIISKTEEVKEDEQEVDHEEIKNPNQLLIIYQTRIELYYMQQRMECNKQQYGEALVTADKLIGFQRHVITLSVSQKSAERSELANLIYLKGQSMERCRKPMEENLACQQEAIELEELNATESGKPKSNLLGRLYRVKGQMYEFLNRWEESAAACEQAL